MPAVAWGSQLRGGTGILVDTEKHAGERGAGFCSLWGWALTWTHKKGPSSEISEYKLF